MKKAFISQPFGIGDCIWSQTIAHRFIDAGYEITWAVYTQFLLGLKVAYPQINWVDINEGNWRKLTEIQKDSHVDGYLIIPIRWCVEIMKVPYKMCMVSKYSMYTLDWTTWKEFAMPVRDMEKEKELFRDVLGLNEGEPYRLTNRFFRSDSSGCAQISVDGSIRNIEMQSIANYSLFDWCYVLEQAQEIHTVSTSVFYLLEILNLKCVPELYVRRPEEHDFRNIESIFSKPYILHT